MPRLPRMKFEDQEGFYHLWASVAGKKGDYPLQKKSAWRKLLSVIRFYTHAYCCDVAAFAIMGNHYHMVLRMDKPRILTDSELRERALCLYPKSEEKIEQWTESDCKRLQERLFDVSELMRNVQSAYARWYNRTHNRKGRFWADRFKSSKLLDGDALVNAVVYVDLNGFRAGLCERPEEFEASSAYLREIRKASWLLDYKEFLTCYTYEKRTHRLYKEILYYHGTRQTKVNQKLISQDVYETEKARGFRRRGVFLKRFRYFTDGVVIGTKEAVKEHLKRMRKAGIFKRRKNPVHPGEGHGYVLREQRKNYIPLE